MLCCQAEELHQLPGSAGSAKGVADADLCDLKPLVLALIGYQLSDDHLRTYFDVQECNARTLAWGPKLVGRTATEIYSTGFELKGEDHFSPSSGKLVEKLSDDLLLGILAKEGSKPLAMVVDKRVSKERGAIPPREIEIKFSSAVGGISILEGKSEKRVKGNLVKLTLPGGGGQLLEID